MNVSQRASARDGSTVVQAGRDVITGAVFTGRYSPLRAAWLDPAVALDQIGLGHDAGAFVGRTWLLDAIDGYLDTARSGWVVVEASAGVGKSALAAYLAATRRWPCHFTRATLTDQSPGRALRSLAAQLVAAQELDEESAAGLGLDSLDQGSLPDEAGEPHWFSRLLTACARRLRDGQRLVLLVDGLDEADPVPGGMPTGLPAFLPDGVFVVATSRTGIDLSPLRGRWLRLTLEPGDARNAADIHAYLGTALATEPLATILAREGIDPVALNNELTDRCGGVWVYLRYVLAEIEQSGSMVDLKQLPADLAGFYAQLVAGYQTEPDWPTVWLPLLAALAVAGQAVTFEQLDAWTGAPPGSGRRLCTGRLRCALTAGTQSAQTPSAGALSAGALSAEAPSAGGRRRGQGRRYGIYHASFREFLLGSGPRRFAQAEDLADELAETAVLAHEQIAVHYLESFGGLAAGLPALVLDPGLAGVHDRYPLRHLSAHLDQGQRSDDLDELLSSLAPDGPNRGRNVWLDTHDRNGTLDLYLADLARAQARAALATNADLAAGRPAPGIGTEIRYALLHGAITTRSRQIPAPLLTRLVTAGLWDLPRALTRIEHLSPTEGFAALRALLAHHQGHPELTERCLAVARALPYEGDRATSLAALAEELPDERRVRLMADVLAIVEAIPDEERRTRALTAVAEGLPTTLLDRALAAAEAVTDVYYRVEGMVAVADRLPASRRAPVLDRALADVENAPDAAYRARTLIAMVGRLPDDRRPAILAAALDAVEAVADEHARVGAFETVFPWLPAELIERALAVAETLGDEYCQVRFGMAVADWLPEDERRVLLTDALDAVEAMTDEHSRTRALSVVVGLLPAELFERVVSVLEAMTDDYSVLETLSTVAGWLPATLFDRALAVAEAFPDESSRALALSSVAKWLPAELAARALSDAEAISGEYLRATTLSALAERLPPHLLERAFAAVEAITSESSRAMALEAVIGVLPAGLLDRALTLVEAITEEKARVAAVTAVADRLPVGLLERALTAAEAVPTGGLRGPALARLAAHLPVEECRSVSVDALCLVEAMPYDSPQIDALTAVVGVLPVELLDRAAAVVRALPDELARVEVSAALAARLPAGRRHSVLVDALDAVETLPDGYWQAKGLAMVADWLPADLAERALAAAEAIPPDYFRADALLALGARLPPELADRALAAADAIPDEYFRTRALVAVAVALPDDRRSGVGAAALTAVENLPTSRHRAEELAEVARRLPADLVDRALAVAEAIPDRNHRVDALVAVAGRLPEDRRSRTMADALPLVERITRGDHRVKVLTTVVESLPSDLLGRALTAVEDWTRDSWRAQVVAACARRLPAGLVDRALALVDGLTDESSRTQALSSLVERLCRDAEAPGAALSRPESLRAAAALRRWLMVGSLRHRVDTLGSAGELVHVLGGDAAIRSAVSSLDELPGRRA